MSRRRVLKSGLPAAAFSGLRYELTPAVYVKRFDQNNGLKPVVYQNAAFNYEDRHDTASRS